jgi:hypothetical protein
MKPYFDKALEQFKIDFQDRNLMIFYDELNTDETLDDYLESTYIKGPIPMLFANADEEYLKEILSELVLYDLAMGCLLRRKNLFGDEYLNIEYWLKQGLKRVLDKFEKAGSIFNSIKTAQAFAKKYCQQENALPLMAVHQFCTKILKSEYLPLRDCPECGRRTLATYSIKGSILSGVHSIKAVCLNQECLHATFMEKDIGLWRYFRAHVEKEVNIPIRFGLKNHTRITL